MKRVPMRIPMPILMTILCICGMACLPPQVAFAGITEGGGTGILDVDTPETLPAGRLSLSLVPRYGYLDASQSRLHTFVGHAGLTLGLSSGLEASAVLPLHALFRTDTDAGAGAIFEEDFSFRARDLELKFRKAFPLGGERLRFALQGVGSAPIGSDRVESVYTPGDSIKPFTSDEWNYGVMALASLDLTGTTGNAPVRLHVNTGYYLNRNENDYRYRSAFRYPLPVPAPTESKQNDLFLLGAGLEFPLGRLSAFGELTTEQLVNQRDLLRFRENPINASAGLRFLFPGGVGLTTGLTLNLSSDDEDTAFDPGDIYPDWEGRVALSFGDILQSRRQRLAQKDRDAREAEQVVQTVPAEEAVSTVAPEQTVTPETPVATETATPEPVAPAETPAKAAPSPAAEPPVAKPAAPTVTAPKPAVEPTPAMEEKPKPEPKPAPPASVPPAMPKEEGDWDGDGVPDDQDRCPRRAEDWDGFRDSDGCPDLDNDQDGILDLDDLCPNSPEDFLAPHPGDGCPSPFRKMGASSEVAAEDKDPLTASVPESAAGNRSSALAASAAGPATSSEPPPSPAAGPAPSSEPPPSPAAGSDPRARTPVTIAFPDADGDLIPDDRDRCPLQAEDADGWEDGDGCPDLDNDGDGFPDLADRCPNAAETWNNYQDEDGCPDLVPGEPDIETRADIEGLKIQAEEQLRMTRQLSDLVSSMQVAAATESDTPFDPQADWDDDGVGDLHDRCPEIREDVDGWQDEDGCPDLDNDGDGILDTADRCPNAAETWNGFQDEDGCPDETPVPQQAVKEPPVTPVPPQKATEPEPAPRTVAAPPTRAALTKPELLLITYFPSGGNALDPFARSSLDELVLELHHHPGRPLEVAGYSDSQGSDAANLLLSRERAKRVVDYLVSSGISRQRFNIVARGETNPVADNASAEGRARNRRVEIRVLPEAQGGPEQ